MSESIQYTWGIQSHQAYLQRQAAREQRHQEYLARQAARDQRHQEYLTRQAAREQGHREYLERQAAREQGHREYRATHSHSSDWSIYTDTESKRARGKSLTERS